MLFPHSPSSTCQDVLTKNGPWILFIVSMIGEHSKRIYIKSWCFIRYVMKYWHNSKTTNNLVFSAINKDTNKKITTFYSPYAHGQIIITFKYNWKRRDLNKAKYIYCTYFLHFFFYFHSKAGGQNWKILMLWQLWLGAEKAASPHTAQTTFCQHLLVSRL